MSKRVPPRRRPATDDQIKQMQMDRVAGWLILFATFITVAALGH